ncbi:MAG: 50S ribosome-binding GTPase [Eubacterium sp.]|nr:50S ribosome-binding GTPase [Eubacterium sp.]
MIIKKFISKTEDEAIELAKQELGKDAVVLNIKKTKPKGLFKFFVKGKVEVTAALEENIDYKANKAQSDGNQKAKAGNTIDLAAEAYIPDIIADSKEKDKDNPTIEEKLDSLQKIIEKQMSDNKKSENVKEQEKSDQDEKKDEDKRDDKDSQKDRGVSKAEACKSLICKQMVKNEVDEEIAKNLIEEIDKSLPKDAALDQILGVIYQKIILMLGQPYDIREAKKESGKNGKKEDKKCRYVFFLGSTGVGKTTTIAKIASKLKIEDEKNIALITADTYRIAAVEQLKTYANILNIPLEIAYTEGKGDRLDDMISQMDQYEYCLIDTAGCSHKNKEQLGELQKLIDMIPLNQREVYLVLNAATKYNDLKEIADVYSKITDYSMIFTKLDETSSSGVMLNMREYTGKPLSYVTWGQNVPEDIGIVDAQKIAKKLLGGNS